MAKLDRLVSDIVRRRDGYQCVVCGSREMPQCGHVIGRMQMGTRFDLRNCYTQCAGCNIKHNYTPHVYINWFVSKWGWAEWEALCARSKSRRFAKDWTFNELTALLEHYEELYERLCSMSVSDEAMMREMGLYG